MKLGQRIDRIEEEALSESIKPPLLLKKAMENGILEIKEDGVQILFEEHLKSVIRYAKAKNYSAESLKDVLDALPHNFRQAVIIELKKMFEL
ncbi:hypothetical protein ACFL0H_00290 [Thermodesulfobacteriota bacterium]